MVVNQKHINWKEKMKNEDNDWKNWHSSCDQSAVPAVSLGDSRTGQLHPDKWRESGTRAADE